MKANISIRLYFLLLTASTAFTASAASLAYEGFDYLPPGTPLNGLSGGSGFTAAGWAADLAITIQPPGLAHGERAHAYDLVNLQVQPGFLADEIRIGTTPGDVAGARLEGTVSRGSLTLTWPVGTLLQAPTLNGPWHTNNAPSPYTIPMTDPQQFYRVIVQ